METKTERFILAMTPEDKAVLWYLAEHEQMSAAAIVRRLIWDAYEASGGLFRLIPQPADRAEARDGDGAGDTRAAGEHDG